MDSLDLFFKKYSYKFPKGYPDMNNEQDINVLADLLESIGINLQEQEQMKLDFPDKDFKKEDTEGFKTKFIDLINNTSDEELEKDPIYKSLFKRLKNFKGNLLDNFKKELENRNIGPLYKAIYNIAEDFGEADDLYNYLISDDQTKSLNSIGTLDDLYSDASKYISRDLFDVLSKKGDISIGNVMMGKGELAIILMMNNAKKVDNKEKGDVQIGDQRYEIKGDKARFSGKGIGAGREGNISQIYSDLAEKYNVESDESLNNYIFNILSEKPDAISDINNILNKIYPNSTDIKLSPENIKSSDSIKNILLKKYITGYISERPDTKYLFITKKGAYQILTTEQLLENLNKYKFTGITKSSAYPQINL
jgi:hypothetical protein